MSVENTSPIADGRSKAFEVYVASSAIAFIVSYAATYAYSFYYGKMSFDSQFHPGSDFPGSLVDPAIHNPDKYNVGVHFFGDFWTTLLRSFKPSPYLSIADLGSSSYPPFAHVLFKPLKVFPYPLALVFFLVGGAAAVIFPILRASRITSWSALAINAICGIGITYPFLFAIDRGNNITLAVGCCLFALALNYQGKTTFAAFLFGVAAAIKVYPILFLLIYANRSKLRHALVGGLTALVLTLISLLTFSGGLVSNASEFVANLRSTGNSGVQVHLNHSLNGLTGALANGEGRSWSAFISWLPAINSRNSIVIFIVIGLLIFCLLNVTRVKDFTPEIVAICCVMQTLLVSLTYGYTLLIYLTVVQAILVTSRSDWWAKASAAIIGVLFASKGIPVGRDPQQLLNFVNPTLQTTLLLISILSIICRLRVSTVVTSSTADQ